MMDEFINKLSTQSNQAKTENSSIFFFNFSLQKICARSNAIPSKYANAMQRKWIDVKAIVSCKSSLSGISNSNTCQNEPKWIKLWT